MNAITDNETYIEKTFKGLSAPELNVSECEFEECDFVDCDLSQSCFARCKFINCSFSGCNLSLASFPYSRINNVQFSHTKLVGVDWTRANWPSFNLDQEISFRFCILNDCSFYGLTMHELILDECKLHDVDFRSGDFTEASITGCDLTNSLFARTNLSQADFSDSVNYTIDVLENRLTGAKFSRFEALALLESLGIELVD